ncbi:MAG: hypothetical protein JST14_00365 [Bacteroidetes bacterium]|nr:hypothetical protein [Bacteroidota bacterium]
MKHIRLLLYFFCLSGPTLLFSQGKFAGGYGSLIGKNYRDEKELTILYGFTSRGGTLLSDPGDPVSLSASWYSKGNLIVAFFEQKDGDKGSVILDVLEIRNVLANQTLSIGDCKDGDNVSVGFVALVNETREERFKAVKAWFFNRDKIRLEPWNPARVTCIGMVGDD